MLSLVGQILRQAAIYTNYLAGSLQRRGSAEKNVVT